VTVTRPAIETARLRLEPFAARHLTRRYVAWLNDPEVVRFSEQRHRRHTIESAAEYVRSFDGSASRLWAIEVPGRGEPHIGNISAAVDAANGVADVGVLIGERSAWGQGYGSEAWTAVCRFLLQQAGVRKVTGGTVSLNLGMLAIMRRAGMQPDGVRARHLVVDGREADVVHMALFRNDEERDITA
jgi:RimJ/RimL family protein N-acetyltransferase